MTKKIVSTETLESVLKTICSEEELQPYENLGNGLYRLPGGVITGKNGLDLYLKILQNEINQN